MLELNPTYVSVIMLQQLSRRHINSAEERFSHVTDPFRNEHTPILPQKPSNASYNVVAAFEKLTPITSSQTLLASLTKQPESLFYFENGDDFFCVIVFSISSLVTSETPSLSFSCYLLGYQAILNKKEQTQYLMEVYAPLCEGIPFDPDNPNKVLPFFSQKSGLYRLDPIDGLFSASSNRRDVPAEKKGTLSALQKRILPLPFHQNE
ncbi:hypothetical protein BLNAU_14807 [Blattamonas nauphoetae]|uniref:Uncharacterized protein n=1 Tax=Blattamonas nauphoetae TaxID=2049346 RepID=A0ABQ9XFY4_9EUKA|nr:hypothetical protein BLNAU_14807 [Blattamonas nauphoetae]